jgi:hypothetical protein
MKLAEFERRKSPDRFRLQDRKGLVPTALLLATMPVRTNRWVMVGCYYY